MGDLEGNRTSVTLRVRDPKVLIYKIKNILRMEERRGRRKGEKNHRPVPQAPRAGILSFSFKPLWSSIVSETLKGLKRCLLILN